MRAIIEGTVAEVDSSSWVGNDGQTRVDHKVYVKQADSSPRFGIEPIGYDPDKFAFAEGEEVRLLVNVKAQSTRAGARLRVWLLESDVSAYDALSVA
jgi:hypothetical protein